MKRPHLEIDSISSDLCFDAEAVEEGGNSSDNDESDPRDGPQKEYEMCETAEQCPEPLPTESLHLTINTHLNGAEANRILFVGLEDTKVTTRTSDDRTVSNCLTNIFSNSRPDQLLHIFIYN